MAEKSSTATKELVFTKIINAPLELVWKAWTDSQMISQWWGPDGFTNPVCRWEPLPGKKIYIDMKAPTGEVYPMDGAFREIVHLKKLVFTSAVLDKNGYPLFEILNTVSFAEDNGQTRLTLHAEAFLITALGETYLTGQEAGWSQSLARLNLLLTTSNRELKFERVFDAPRDLVFEAWTKPEHLARWWGPNGFTITTKSMEAKPGGIWKYTMHGPDGRDYPNKMQFISVDPPQFLSYHHVDDGETEPVSFHVQVHFQEHGTKTRVLMHMIFESAEDLVRVSREYGAIEGANQTLGRLDNLLLSQIYSTRVIRAPREKVWEAWINPNHLKNWWGPNGFSNTFHIHDPRPGGDWRFTMHGPDGTDYLNECRFVDIRKPELLTWDHLSRPEFRAVIDFEELPGACTRVGFHMIFNDPGTCAQVKSYADGKNEENFDRLETELKKM